MADMLLTVCLMLSRKNEGVPETPWKRPSPRSKLTLSLTGWLLMWVRNSLTSTSGAMRTKKSVRVSVRTLASTAHQTVRFLNRMSSISK